MVIETNDFQQPFVYVPINLLVTQDDCGGSLIGDINQDNVYNVLDVILTVNLVLSESELDECEFYNADLNSDGVLNILDVIEKILIENIPRGNCNPCFENSHGGDGDRPYKTFGDKSGTKNLKFQGDNKQLT